MRVVVDKKPVTRALKTGATLNNEGITYNEAGVTYNDPLYMYGGVSGEQDKLVLSGFVIQITPVGLSRKTTAILEDQGITYNESGVTYNDILYNYGGLVGQSDFIPQFARAKDIKPVIDFIGNQWSAGTAGTVSIYAGQSMGPGFFLYITYPVNQ